MKNKCWIIILMSFVGLTSCSAVPNPQTHEYTDQLTVEAAQHWGVMAQDFAKQATSAMQADPVLVLFGREGHGESVDKGDLGYISENDSNPSDNEIPAIYLQTNDVSDFGRTFRSYLITELTKLGYPIAHSPKGAVSANWSLNKIYHNADRTASGLPGIATGASALGYGVYKIIEESSSLFPAVLAAAVAIDLYNATDGYILPGQVSHAEIVLTFTVSKDTKVLHRQTQAYYVNAEDFNHYSNIADYAGQESQLKPVAFKVTNSLRNDS